MTDRICEGSFVLKDPSSDFDAIDFHILHYTMQELWIRLEFHHFELRTNSIESASESDEPYPAGSRISKRCVIAFSPKFPQPCLMSPMQWKESSSGNPYNTACGRYFLTGAMLHCQVVVIMVSDISGVGFHLLFNVVRWNDFWLWTLESVRRGFLGLFDHWSNGLLKHVEVLD